MRTDRKIRIGIDVGGTFTHAVAIDARTLDLVGKSKVPTTHQAAEGVARGVVDSLLQLLAANDLRPDDILLIAHSTTQATNALLEGDVAPVGIIGMGRGPSALLARKQTAIRPIQLAPGRYLQTTHQFITADAVSATTIDDALDVLVKGGAKVVVAAEAFSVDDPRHEALVCDRAARRELPATATHHVSRLHGLGIRTRTAVINASMVPTMLATANLTAQAVRDAGITAPVMIMRSDGGVMDINEMRRRPILTMLSGPAAGVAAALLYGRVSDGLFLEVGGTSTDISAIKNGRCQIRTAEIGGQKLHVSTLDVRTVGVAGGSLVYLRNDEPKQVGPRSSHIAGLPYLSFTELPATQLSPASFEHEGSTYLTLGDGVHHVAVTPTCCSNQLGLVPDGDPAGGNRATIAAAFEKLAAKAPAGDGAALAERLMQLAAPKVIGLVAGLIKNYKLDPNVIQLIGGGGGASAIVPFVARTMNLPHENVANADVISAIGVALALVRDTIERTVIEPSEEDIRAIRQQAFESVLNMGAAADTIDVFVEVDAKRNLLRATAEGSTEIRERDLQAAALDEPAQHDLVTKSIRNAAAPPRIVADAAGFTVWQAPHVAHRLWRFFPETRQAVRVLDHSGAICWASNHAAAKLTTVAQAEPELTAFAEQYTHYSDAGVTIPRIFVLLNQRIIDLSGLVEMKQVLELLRIELKRAAPRESCIVLIDRGTT
jgi:N-methylhydantoinase A